MRDEDLHELLVDNEIDSRFKLTDSKNTSMSNMHLYNSNCIIQKYLTPIDILKEFYNIRMEYYTKRKEFKISKLEKQLLILNAKVRFINDFINKNINIINEEDEVINKQLEDLEYPKIDDSFDYLLNMSIRTLTKKRSDELNNSHDNKETELNILKGKTEKDLWLEDLTELEDFIKKMMIHFEETYFGENSSKPTHQLKKKLLKKLLKKPLKKKNKF